MPTMIRMKQTRIAHTKQGTFGVLQSGPLTIYTCEDPWLNNESNISCIPLGTYNVVRHPTERHPEGWLVLDVPDRFAIMFHVGNTIEDTQGCILPGTALATLNNRWAVRGSATAMQQLNDFMGGINAFTLDIVEADPYNRNQI